MRKFDSRKDRKLFPNLTETYSNNDFELDKFGFIEEIDGHHALFTKEVDKNGNAIKVYRNILAIKELHGFYFDQISEEEVVQLKKTQALDFYREVGVDLIHKRKEYLDQAIHSRKYRDGMHKGYTYKIFHECEKSEIETMMQKWADEKRSRGKEPKDYIEDILFVLDNREKYNTKSVFVKIDTVLLGFAVGINYSKDSDTFVNLFCYALTEKYRNISTLLKVKVAELYEGEYILDAVYPPLEKNSVYTNKIELAKPEMVRSVYLVRVT